jgi:phosphoribosylformimino-5-aminoimidazole carboxamide ribotide isomerase
MEIIPSFDVRDGKAILTTRGSLSAPFVLGHDVLDVADRFRAEGAQHLHVVDLDGAITGSPANRDLLKRISSEVGLPLHVGGGIRSLSAIEEYLDRLAERVVLSTAAVEDRPLIAEAYRLFGDRVLVELSVRAGQVVTHGMTRSANASPSDVVRLLQQLGGSDFVLVDVERIGVADDLNWSLIRRLVGLVEGALFVGGGVSSLKKIRRLSELGVHGVLIGRALHTGALSLPAAIQAGKPAH